MIKYLQKLFSQKLFSPKYEAKDYELDFLKPYAVLFGSRIWGGYTNKSDVDFIIREIDVPFIIDKLIEHGFTHKKIRTGYDQVLSTITFKCNSLVYSLSVLSDLQFNKNILAIPIMTEFSKSHSMKSKDVRKWSYISILDIIGGSNINASPRDIKKFIEEFHPELMI